MVSSVVSMLDTEHRETIEDVRVGLREEFGVDSSPGEESYPHFPYHVAEGYEQRPVESVLERAAKGLTVFTVETDTG